MKSNLLLTCVICLICINTYGQSYSEIQKRAEAAFDAYDLPQAVELGEAALKLAAADRDNHPYDYAAIQNDLGVYYAFNNEAEKGIQYMEESNELIKQLKGEQSEEYIEHLNNLTSVCYYLNEFQKALEAANASIRISKVFYGNKHPEYAYALNSQGMVLVVLGNYAEAEQTYLEALAIYETDKRSEEYASVLSNLGDLCISQGKYYPAEDYLLKAVKFFQKTGETNSKPYSDCLFTLGKVYKMIGDYEKALVQYSASADILKNLLGEDHPEYATTLSAEASVYEGLGQYTEAEELYMQALSIKKKTIGENDLSYFISANNLAGMFISLDRNEEALAILEPIVINASAEAANYPLDYVSFGANLALVYQRLGRLAEAQTMYESLLLIQEAILGKDHFEHVTLLNNLATLKIEQEQFGEADLLFDRCLSILEAQEFRNSGTYVDILYMKGLNLMNDKQFVDAKKYLIKSAELSNTVYGTYHKMYAAISINLGYLFYKINEPKQAAVHFTNGMDCYRTMVTERLSFMPEEEKEQLKNDIQLHFSFFNQFVLSNPTPELLEALYDYHIMLKSMIIDTKVNVRKEVLSSNDQNLKNLFTNWSSAREMLNRLYSFSSEDLLAEHVNIDSIASYVKTLENKLALQSATLQELKHDQATSWKDIQQQLADDEAAIEIIRTAYYGEADPIPVKYLAMILSSQTTQAPEFVVLDEGRLMENEWIDDFYYELFRKKPDSLSYDRFWSDIVAKVSNKKKLYVSRTGVYHVLNISTFMNPRTKDYVLDEQEIALVGNTKDVLKLKKQKDTPLAGHRKAVLFGYPNYYLDIVENESQKDELLAMANSDDRAFQKDFELLADLPGTKKEVENISNILNDAQWNTTVYLEDEATETQLKNLNNPSVLHIATHGFFDWQYEGREENDVSRTDRSVARRDPLYRSGLMMAGSGFVVKLVEGNLSLINNLEDGVLSAYEVVNMDLSNTELVVLSACLSGIGETKIKETESFSGLPQAFIIAGAQAVVTSGWSVDDTATQELMTLFYGNLARNMPKREALREAQLELKKKFPQPFFWGPFSMVGQ